MHRMISSLALVLLLVVPAALQAQACFGLPQTSSSAFAGGLGAIDASTTYGISGTMGRAGSSLFAGASAAITSVEHSRFGGTDYTIARLGATLAHEITPLKKIVSVCPSVGVQYGFHRYAQQLSLPLALRIGRTLPLGKSETTTLTPYLAPRYVFSRLYSDSHDLPERLDRSYEFNIGANIAHKRVFLGVFLGELFELSGPFFGVQAGYAF